MPFEEVKYEFPHESKDDPSDLEIELEPSSAETLDLDKPAPEKKETIVYEVIDDTPPEDRNRTPAAEPPADVTDEELENYSQSVQSRIKHFSKGYHDERRAKEEAQRERAAIEELAKKAIAENNRLKQDAVKNRAAVIEQVKRMLETEITTAKKEYAEAYESGNTERLMQAEEKLQKARLRQEKVNTIKNPLPKQENKVQGKPTPSQPRQQPAPKPAADPRAQEWASNNPWFGQDDEMTSFALGLHQKLVKSGIDPKSDEYYEKVNSRMQEVFSDYFGKSDGGTAKSSNNVAPATRGRAPKKIKLKKSQIAVAKRLGVPLEAYARQVAEEQMRNRDNG